MPTVSARAIAAIPAAAIGLLVLVVMAIVIHPVVGLVLGVVAAALVLWLIVGRATASALGALGASPLPEGSEPRLESLVESVCASHGIAEPVLYVVDSPAIDAAVAGKTGDTHLVLTRGLLDGLDRLEMEAVIARELSMFGSGIEAATVLTSVAAWIGPLAANLRDRLLDDRRLVRADFEAVNVTRYPPALAAAFEKAGAGPRVDHEPRADHLWMIGSGVTSVQPDVTERIDTLREL